MLVRNDDKGIYTLSQLLDALLCKAKLLLSFESEGSCHHSHSKGIAALGNFSHYCSGTGASSATHTGSNEDHVCILQLLLDLFLAFLGCLLSNFWLATSSKTSCKLLTDGNSGLGIGTLQCLNIGVKSHEGNLFKAVGNHSVDSISTATAYSYNLDDGWCGLLTSSCVFNIK